MYKKLKEMKIRHIYDKTYHLVNLNSTITEQPENSLKGTTMKETVEKSSKI